MIEQHPLNILIKSYLEWSKIILTGWYPFTVWFGLWSVFEELFLWMMTHKAVWLPVHLRWQLFACLPGDTEKWWAKVGLTLGGLAQHQRLNAAFCSDTIPVKRHLPSSLLFLISYLCVAYSSRHLWHIRSCRGGSMKSLLPERQSLKSDSALLLEIIGDQGKMAIRHQPIPLWNTPTMWHAHRSWEEKHHLFRHLVFMTSCLRDGYSSTSLRKWTLSWSVNLNNAFIAISLCKKQHLSPFRGHFVHKQTQSTIYIQ